MATPSRDLSRILVLFAHPALHKSRVHRQWMQVAKNIPGITFHDLYAEYPNLHIDVEREQKLLLEHDVIVAQHPIYWYSVPAILKEWADLVLEYGFAYGEGGEHLAGKKWIHAISAGGSEQAYSPSGANRFTIEQFLATWDQTAHLCEMNYLKPFVLYNSLKLDPETEIRASAEDYRKLLTQLQNGGDHS